MTKGFQQQNPWATFSPPRADSLPQHGQKADASGHKPPPARISTRRPAH